MTKEPDFDAVVIGAGLSGLYQACRLRETGVEGADNIDGFWRHTWDDFSHSLGSRLSNLSSIAFGGAELKIIYLGGLGMDGIQVLPSPVAGMSMEHWL